MEQARHKRFYSLHSWAGILLGLFIYVVSFSGVVALFGDEIISWEDPNLRLAIPETPIAMQSTFDAFAKKQQEQGELSFLTFNFPVETQPYYSAIAGVKTENGAQLVKEKWHPTTAQILPHKEDGLSHWILDFHRKLMLPTTLGRTLVGIAGIVLLVLTVTGILIHGKIIKDFFTLRLTRSDRLKWQDSHKVLGIFGLPFSIMIAFTGAFLGVVTILGPAVALIAFQGNTEALIAKVIGAPLEPAGASARIYSLDTVAALKHPETGLTPIRVITSNYGDKNARYDVLFPPIEELTTYHRMELDGTNGSLIQKGGKPKEITPATRVIDALTPLHYATYGPLWLKAVYAVLGMFLCILVVTGLMLFIERRLHGSEGGRSKAFYTVVNRTNIGVTMGFPIGTAALFYVDKLYTGQEISRIFWIGTTYFTVAAAVTLFALSQKNGFRSMRNLLTLLGVLTAGIPVLNIITTGSQFWVSNSIGQSFTNGVDISAFLLGLSILVAATQIPEKRNRPAEKQPRSVRLAQEVPAE